MTTTTDLPLIAIREVSMPTDDVLAAGAEDDFYQQQIPQGWTIIDGVPGSACDGRELLETEYTG